MSTGSDRVLARALVSAMNDDVGQPPEELLARVLGETERARPLPRLVALVVEPPIVMPARVVVGIRRSRLLMVAAALLIATTLVASGTAGAWVERLNLAEAKILAHLVQLTQQSIVLIGWSHRRITIFKGDL